jgi:hypothetical protein
MSRTFRPFRLQPPIVVPRANLVASLGVPPRLLHREVPHPLRQGSARRSLGFTFPREVRHDDRPNRVRHPTDWSFTSWCSPPPVTGTQFLSVTGCRFHPGEDFHLAGSVHLRTHLGNLRLLVLRVASCHAVLRRDLVEMLADCALGIRGGVAHAMEPACDGKRRQDVEARPAWSERRPGGT